MNNRFKVIKMKAAKCNHNRRNTTQNHKSTSVCQDPVSHVYEHSSKIYKRILVYCLK